MSNKYFFFFVGIVLFIFSLVFPSFTYAFEQPHLYYDWNTYYSSSQDVLGVQAFAQTTTGAPKVTSQTGNYRNYRKFSGYVLGFTANISPDNPFYALKRAQENLSVAFTSDPKQKESMRIGIAGQRLAEMEKMANLGKANAVVSLSSDYNSTIQSITNDLKRLKSQKQDVVPLLAATDVEFAKHVLLLEEVSLKVPPQATRGIDTALSASQETVDTVADLAGRPALPQEMVSRLQALRAQGLLTTEEVTKLTSVNLRTEARDELRKLREAKVLPAADFTKLDESARAYFPKEYATTIEIQKFKELKDLETQKPDKQTLKNVQEFASTYKPGDAVPPELRRWWVPLIRLEELQNTIRPDLIKEDLFKYRPDEAQKYKELVERVKPRTEDIEYINKLIDRNPAILNDPAYARIKAIGDKFGTSEAKPIASQAASCSKDSHWVLVPFMPNSGYCVPNLVYGPVGDIKDTSIPCPPGYHRNEIGGACYPDNPYGPGVGTRIAGIPAIGSCQAGYHWVPLPQTGGYCAPDSPTPAGGAYPGPISVPSYCPTGQIFIDGKCLTYNPPPKEGCSAGTFWSGTNCIDVKDCGTNGYQDANGNCKTSTDNYYLTPSIGGGGSCIPPSSGCGFNSYFDYGTCTCKATTSDYQTPSYQTPGFVTTCNKSPTDCTSSGSYLDYGTCTCKTNVYQSPSSGGTETNCGSGYYWTGTYCAANGTYATPAYSTPTGSYQTPSYLTPSGTYGTPSYGTPTTTYSTPPAYGTPSYSTPPSYATPSTYGTPPSYSTPPDSYSTPPSYGTPP